MCCINISSEMVLEYGEDVLALISRGYQYMSDLMDLKNNECCEIEQLKCS